MKSNNLTLGEILNSPNQYVIPVFQRYYRWDQPEWDKVWADLAALQQPEKTGRHFLGFLVLVPESVMLGRISKFHLIDGQQRLTTLSLLLCALRDVANASGFTDLAREVAHTTLEHPFKKGDDRYRLSPKLRDRDQYVACLNGEPPAEGRLGAAVRYYSGLLTTIPGAGTEDGLRAFFDLLTRRLEFINAQLEGENPFNIFKSLNSTGVPLGQSDLIRNFIFMNVAVEDQDVFDEALWKFTERRFEDAQGNLDADAFSYFLRDYLMRDGEYIPPAQTFEAFQRHYAATDFDPKQVAAELKQASGWYEIILGREPDPSPEVEAALDGLRQLESSTTHALLLNLYRRRHLGTMSQSDLTSALRLLAGFILRRLVCNEGSRAYSRLFVQAAATLGQAPLDDLRRYLESRGYPDTPRFVHEFVRFNLYASRYRKPVLETLERAHEHKEPVVLAKAQVEHILPQNLSDAWRAALGPEAQRIHATWLHTPGNLTLTGYNAELSNKPFEVKRREYHDSNIVMTRQLAKYDSWGEPEIQSRGLAMAEIAGRLWPGPDAPVPRPRDEGSDPETPSRYELRHRFWTGFREFVKASGSPLDLREPLTTYYMPCGRLTPGVSLYAHFNLKHGRLSVAVLLQGEKGIHASQSFREHRDAIESEVGAKLALSIPPAGDRREILLHNPVDLTNEVLWPSYYDWMCRTLETFRRVFGHHLQRIEDAEKPGSEAASLSATQQFQLEYWTALRETIRQSGSDLKPPKPPAQSWITFAVGRSGFYLSADVSKTKRRLDVKLALDGPLAKPHFHLLQADKDAIEAEIGAPLEWRELPDKKRSYIRLSRDDADPSDRDDWPRQHAWYMDTLEAFHRTFAPRLKSLKPNAHLSEKDPG